MSDYILVYISCKDIAEARKIAGHCVTERLAACGNIHPNMESVYWWDGDIHSNSESVLILKTHKRNYKDIEAAVLKLHSYECPSIIAVDIENGSEEYLNWLNEESRR